MTSMRSKATPELVRSVILAVALIRSGSTPAAVLARQASPPTDVPVSADSPVAPDTQPDEGMVPDVPIPTDQPTEAPVEPVAVPLPTLVVAWTPAPQTKTTGCVSQGGLPDPACTPGALDPRVSDTTMGATICTSGYTATVRPLVSVTTRIKREQMAAYGLQVQPLSGFGLDHLISLELGGAPADVANLWPEPWTGDGNAHQKDAIETQLKREVCSGTVLLAEAQRMIATDWLAVYHARGLQPSP